MKKAIPIETNMSETISKIVPGVIPLNTSSWTISSSYSSMIGEVPIEFPSSVQVYKLMKN